MIQSVSNVYKKISSVAGELARIGITKDRKNTTGSGFLFRGIDDVYNVLGPLLAKHGLVVTPTVLNRHTSERTSKSGQPLFCTCVDMDFTFIDVDNPESVHTARMVGEAFDSGDKSTSKACSMAYKYVMLQTFCIPTEGDNDADSSTHELASQEITENVTEKFAPSKKDCWDYAKELGMDSDSFKALCAEKGIDHKNIDTHTQANFNAVWVALIERERARGK